jgi:dolichol-phosphate mannosyltransferase
VFKQKRTKHALIIPVFNEGSRFISQIRKMQGWRIFDTIDVIVADVGSNDGSTALDMLKDAGFLALLIRKGSGRYSTDLRMAYHWAMKQGYEGLITVDGNDKDDVRAITRFMEKLDDGYDYVQGSRFIKGGQAIRTPLSRLFAIRCILTPIMSLSARRLITDGSNGFRAYSKKFLLDNRIMAFRDSFIKYELIYYLPTRAGALGFKCIEIPVTRAYPESGEIPTTVTVKANMEVIMLLIRILFGLLNPRGAK